VLEDCGIDTLVFAGVATNSSVESTARVATDAGYRVIIAEDACSAATPEAHRASIESLGLLAEISTAVGIVGASASQTRLEAGPGSRLLGAAGSRATSEKS
jgi:nicotinamidase-related amidase